MTKPVNRAQRRAMLKYKNSFDETIVRRRMEKKKAEVMKLFKRHFMDAATEWVPKRLRIASLYLPPKLYLNIFDTIVNGKSIMEYQKKVYMNLSWSEWRKRLNVWPVTFVYRVLRLLLIDWIIIVRRYVATFGLTVHIIESKPGYLKQTIRHWGAVVRETEVKVGI